MKLVIKGHPTKGNKVIEILEMLGGINVHHHKGNDSCVGYTIEENEIRSIPYILGDEDFNILSIEEFLEKYPYRIGDKVITNDNDKFIGTITDVRWQGDSFFVGKEEGDIVYTIQVSTTSTTAQITYQKEQLQPYKEEAMRDNLITEEDFNNTPEIEQEYLKLAENLIDQLAESTRWKCNEFDSQKMLAMFLKKNIHRVAKKDDSIIFNIPKGYEFAGVDDDNQRVVFTKIQSQYPKTFVDVLNFRHPDRQPEDDYQRCYKKDLIEKFQDLLYARDAYWEIAGEEMGLGKPWKPEKAEVVHAIFYNFYDDTIDVSVFNLFDNVVLCFPTEEMMNAFYENFKNLIEECKELL